MFKSNFLKIKSPHIKRYLTNTSWVFADFILRQGLNLFVGIYVARYLNPEGLGALSYASTYVQLFQPIAYIGLSLIVIRDLIQEKSKTNEILGTAFVFKAIASLGSFLFILGLVLVLDIPISSKWNIIIVSLSLMISPFQVIDFYFQSEVKAKYITYAQQVAAIGVGFLKLLGVFGGFKLSWFIWMVLAEAVFTGLMLMFFFWRNNLSVRNWKYNTVVANRFLKELLPYVFSGFFIILYMKIDQLMIFNMLDAKALGIYAAAVKLCEPFYIVSTLVCSSLFPAIISGLVISRKEYEHRLQRLFNILTWLSITVSIGVHIFAEPIIHIVYGDKFAGAGIVLQTYFWASVFVFQGVVSGQAFAAEKMQSYNTFNTFVGAIINIGLNMWLIPLFGVKGAAFSTLISYFIAVVLMNAIFKKTRFIFRQQAYAYIAIFTKPKSLLSAFYARKADS